MFAYVIIEDVSFEVEQEQSFEEVEPQFLGKKASVFFSHAYSFFVLITSMLSHFKFYMSLCINLMGNAY
jgi:hypothetical protein